MSDRSNPTLESELKNLSGLLRVVETIAEEFDIDATDEDLHVGAALVLQRALDLVDRLRTGLSPSALHAPVMPQ